MVKDAFLFLRHFLFSFDGRINRAKMWIFSSWWLLAIYAANQLSGWDLDATSSPSSLRTGLGYFGAAVAVMFGLMAFYCFTAVTAKRLHDRNRSAWWLVLLLGAQLAQIGIDGNAPGASLVAVISWIVAAWFAVEALFLAGTPGNNRFGLDPLPPIKEPSPEQVTALSQNNPSI